MNENLINESLSDEFMQALVESDSDKYKKINNVFKKDCRILMENTRRSINEQTVNEGTLTADIAQFTPILLPMVRRIYPNLIAHEILGVQPMSMPTGYIYAWVNKYVGTGVDKVAPSGKAVIVKLDVEPTDIEVGATVNTDGKLLHKEGKFALIAVGDTDVAIDTVIGATAKVVEIYTNEASFNHILKNYTGPYSTAAGEVLGKDMKELGFEVIKKAIEVQTRAVKTPFTVEMYQDLKAQHGQIADEELIDLASYELQAEIDRECVAAVNSWAMQAPNTAFRVTTNAEYPTARWELEAYRAEAVRLDKEAALIGVRNKRGQGNVVIVSPKMAVMLKQTGNFAVAPVANNVEVPAAGGIAGVYDNRYTVVVDQYAESDYCTVLYKGYERTDAIGFYCPYVPIAFTRVVNPDSGQPAIIAKTRYNLTSTPGAESSDSLDRAQTYATSYGVDFSKTILA